MSKVYPDNLIERIKREAHLFKDAPDTCVPDTKRHNLTVQQENPPHVLCLSDFYPITVRSLLSMPMPASFAVFRIHQAPDITSIASNQES